MVECSELRVECVLKPCNYLFFNCPTLKGGAIDVLDILGFSPIPLIFDASLHRTHDSNLTPPKAGEDSGCSFNYSQAVICARLRQPSTFPIRGVLSVLPPIFRGNRIYC